MQALWREEDIELLELIARDEQTRGLLLRMAALWRNGSLAPFIEELTEDAELDADTAAAFAELATDTRLLHAVEEYVRRTERLH